MGKKISLGAAIAFMTIVAAVTFSMTMVYSMRTFNDKVYSIKERERMYSKIAEIDGIARQNFIGTIEETDLMDSTAAGFLTGIGDAYAQYYDAASYAKMLENFGGKSVQIGIVTKMDESGYIKVTEVYPDSPAQAAGIEPDNLIVKIDETDVTKDNFDEAVNMLKGEAGTKMTIIVRKGVEDVPLEMTRRFVEIPSVSSSMLDQQIGLIKIKEFNDNTPEQFSKQTDKLIGEGAQALILDVRGVNTGTLRSVAQSLDKLLPEGVLVYSTDKSGNKTVVEKSDAREVKLPMAVLVNEKTSGEAELFAQDIRDYSKGKVVGAKTAGKGTMQTIFPLTDGSAIKLTTARYTPKTSPSFDGEGVKPDYEVKLTEDQVALAALGGVENDPQLKKAFEVAIAGIKSAAAGAEQQTQTSSGSSSSTVAPSQEASR
ncbi:S41 family peptidase [Oscillospiraceae bacterium PP1C4]